MERYDNDVQRVAASIPRVESQIRFNIKMHFVFDHIVISLIIAGVP